MKNFVQFINEDTEKGKINKGWYMRQVSGAAVKGFKSYLDGDKFEDNPYNTEVEYKDWCAGWRNGEDATPQQIEMFKWIYSIHD